MTKSDYSRRSFLQKGLLTSTALFATPILASSEQKFTKCEELPKLNWRLTSSYPKSLDAIYKGSEIFAENVRLMTGGRFNIQVFAPAEIAPGLEALGVVSNGTVEMCHTASYYYVGKDDTFAFGTTLPFGMNARQKFSWYLSGGGKELLQEFYDNYNVQHFICGNTGAQMGGWFRREVNSLEDLKGLKIRISGIAGRIFEKMGAVPQQIAGGDVYPALEKGTIDAAEWIGPYDDEKLGFYKVAKYYYYPGWWEGGAMLNMFINKQKYNALPPEYQKILELAATQTTMQMVANYDIHNPEALRRIAAQGVQLRPFNEKMMKALQKVAFDLYENNAKTNENFAKIWRSYKEHMREMCLWFKFSENHFDNFIFYNDEVLK